MDGQLEEPVRRRIWAHLAQCRNCFEISDQQARIKVSLGMLPARVPPARLQFSLRSLASREIARRRGGVGFAARFGQRAGVLQFRLDGLMRPLALPFAGGLVSALMLFSMLVPQFPRRTVVSDDVPTMLTTEASLKSTLSFGLGDDDIVVDVLVDESGRMLDYWVPDGQRWDADPQLRRSIEKTLVCTQFTPATMFGMPASGKLRITLRRSHVEVKG
jgi:hypothetical protein